MLSTASIFELYQEEKASLDELDPFPTFAIWKREYLISEQEDFVVRVIDKPGTIDTTIKAPPRRATKKKSLTNMDRARIIFAEMFDLNKQMPERKDVMAALMKELHISKACSSTYHHNIKQSFVDNK